MVLPWPNKLNQSINQSIYSASVVDKETTFCRRLNHDIGPPFNKKTKPLLDFRVSKHPA